MGVDTSNSPAKMRAPAEAVLAEAGEREAASQGVDRHENPCMMLGSLGRYGAEVER